MEDVAARDGDGDAGASGAVAAAAAADDGCALPEAQGLGDYEFVPWQIGATM